MKKKRNTKKRHTVQQWIDKLNKKHNFKYDYSLVTEIKSDRLDKIPIKCENNHLFYQTIHDHINGNGCRFCSFPCYDTESFIKLSNERHGSKYDYSKVDYKTQDTKVIIICPDHGEFLQKAANHYHLMRGCSKCRESKGEIKIRKWLQDRGIRFTKNKTFDGCVNLNKLQYDFYLEDLNICIEFDGLQHYKPVKQFGGGEEFERIQRRDRIKNEFCENNGVKLIRIGYKNLDSVEEILQQELCLMI